MKILILGANQKKRYNWGHQLFKDEIARQYNVRFYGEGHKFWEPGRVDIYSILKVLEFQPNVILSYMGKYCKWVGGLSDLAIPKVHVVVDYFPWNYDIEDSFIRKHKIDLVLPVCNHEVRKMRQQGFNARHLPFGVDTEVFQCDHPPRNMEVMAVFSVVNWAYPTRNRILSELRTMRVSGFLRASWPQTRLWHQDYIDVLCRSKIVVNGVDRHKSLNWKFLEPCACGAMLLTEEAEDMAQLGFRDATNCVVFNDLSDMREKVRYYLGQDEEREAIAKKGQELVRSSHSLVRRVQEFSHIIEEEFGIADC